MAKMQVLFLLSLSLSLCLSLFSPKRKCTHKHNATCTKKSKYKCLFPFIPSDKKQMSVKVDNWASLLWKNYHFLYLISHELAEKAKVVLFAFNFLFRDIIQSKKCDRADGHLNGAKKWKTEKSFDKKTPESCFVL
jgi:hypothetical protein